MTERGDTDGGSGTDDGLQAIFEEAIGLDGGRRAALIAGLSPAHAARLRALLAIHDSLPPEPPRAEHREPDPERLIGRRLGGFTVTALLASGGTSHVFVARQESPARDIVLKVRRARHGTDGQIARFLAEAERLAAFVHPGVAHVYGSGVEQADDGAIAWIAMERIEGTSLDAWRDAAPRTVRERCEMLALVATIVAAAHEAGLVHRDVAPRNVAIDRSGRPRVLDFGISRTLHAIDSHPSIEGTPGFASPEQCAGLPASPSDDVHGLGKLLEWLVPDAPAGLAALCRRAIGPPGARPTAADLADTLRRSAARPRWPLAIGAVTLLAAVAWASSAVVGERQAQRAAAQDAEVQSILQAVLASTSSIEDRAATPAAIQAADAAERRITDASGASPAVRWRAMEQLATTWRDFGRYNRAAVAADAAATLAQSDPAAPALVALRLRAFAAVQAALSDDHAMADQMIDRSVAELATAAARVGEGGSPPAPGDGAATEAATNCAQALKHVALGAKIRGRLDLAADLTARAAPFFRTGIMVGTRGAVTYFINAARLQLERGDTEQAVALAAEAVQVSRSAEAGNELGQLHTRMLQAGILEEAGRAAEAAPIYADELQVWSRIGGPLHPRTITALNNLGLNALRQGQPQRAVELLQDACKRALESEGERHAHTIDDHGNLAMALEGCGRRDEALAIVDRFLPILREVHGSPCEDECAWLRLRARLLAAKDHRDEALATLRQAVAQARGLRDGGRQLRIAEAALAALGTAEFAPPPPGLTPPPAPTPRTPAPG